MLIFLLTQHWTSNYLNLKIYYECLIFNYKFFIFLKFSHKYYLLFLCWVLKMFALFLPKYHKLLLILFGYFSYYLVLFSVLHYLKNQKIYTISLKYDFVQYYNSYTLLYVYMYMYMCVYRWLCFHFYILNWRHFSNLLWSLYEY